MSVHAHCADTQGTPARLRMTSTQRTELVLLCKDPFPFSLLFLALSLLATHCPSTYSVPGILGSWKHKGKSSGGSLCQPQGEGFPGRKPNLLAILSSSGVYGLLFAAWRQLHPARGQGILGLLIHSFLSILYPNFQFWEVNMQFFPPCNFPCCGCGCQSSWKMWKAQCFLKVKGGCAASYIVCCSWQDPTALLGIGGDAL